MRIAALLFAFVCGTNALPYHWRTAQTKHQSGGEEHVVILSADAPHAHDVLRRIGLSPSHADVRHVYNNSAFRGFAASMQSHSIDALNTMSDIEHLEKAVQIKALTLERPDSPWGLQRISSNVSLSGSAFSLDYTYDYEDPNLGTGVDIYVVDTGIYTANIGFGGRAQMGYSFESNISDENGHGTHVSGIAASSFFGVASGANLIGVKVLGADGTGTSSDAVGGIDYAVQRHDTMKTQPGFVGSIMSMSWGLEGESSIIDAAITAALQDGMHVSLAAGNDADDACSFSPARLGGAGSSSGAITAGSIGLSTAISSFSDTGPCVDVYAPGEDIVSTWIGANNSVAFMTGTSMSAPHVAGLIAYLMTQDADLAASPTAMKSTIVKMALQGLVQGSPVAGDAMLLLNNGITNNGIPAILRRDGNV